MCNRRLIQIGSRPYLGSLSGRHLTVLVPSLCSLPLVLRRLHALGGGDDDGDGDGDGGDIGVVPYPDRPTQVGRYAAALPR